jgi:hypothetical protein
MAGLDGTVKDQLCACMEELSRNEVEGLSLPVTPMYQGRDRQVLGRWASIPMQ